MYHWDFKAGIYRQLREFWPVCLILEQENECLLRLLTRIQHPVRLVIDIGCGTGNAVELIRQNCLKIAVDSSIPMLRQLRLRHPGVLPVCADVRCLPFKPKIADLVLAIGLFEYFSSVNRLFEEIRAIIKDERFLIFTSSYKNVFNYLRILLGQRIYPMQSPEMMQITTRASFRLIAMKKSWLQEQFLMQKSDG